VRDGFRCVSGSRSASRAPYGVNEQSRRPLENCRSETIVMAPHFPLTGWNPRGYGARAFAPTLRTQGNFDEIYGRE
jgi:hypothetical protein